MTGPARLVGDSPGWRGESVQQSPGPEQRLPPPQDMLSMSACLSPAEAATLFTSHHSASSSLSNPQLDITGCEGVVMTQRVGDAD